MAEQHIKLLKDLVPPIVSRFLLRVYLLTTGAGWHVFRGAYPTFADVPAASGGMDNDWFVADAIKPIEGLRFELSHSPKGEEVGRLMLPLVVSQLLGPEKLTVLDFGGGAARGLNSILEHVPNIDLARLNYILVETPAMCQAVRSALTRMRFEGVEVVEQIPSKLSHPLIVQARGSIQYIPDYRATLSSLLALAPEIFIIDQTPVTDAPTFAQQQCNNPNHAVARWVFNRNDLISEVEKSGYRLAFIFDHQLPVTHKDSKPSNDVGTVFHRLTP
jgi:putative methyltransferase (TIGR04325 family)